MLCLMAGRLASFCIIRGDFGKCGEFCVRLHVIGFTGLLLLLVLMVGVLLRTATRARSRIEFDHSSTNAMSGLQCGFFAMVDPSGGQGGLCGP